jgi:putative AdoMet-dependent methyltransferase
VGLIRLPSTTLCPSIAIDDPFPASDFDPWAGTYDQDVRTYDTFPFAGYDEVLGTVVTLADAQPGMSVLDLGTGTANLTLRFAGLGCELWCTDFSDAMLAKARTKLPQAHFVQADLRMAWPAELARSFDRIVSGYVFHHFELEKKVSFCKELISERLTTTGRMVIADIFFPTPTALEEFKQPIDDWEDEFYWIADEALPALKRAGLDARYIQVSPCAGVYCITG